MSDLALQAIRDGLARLESERVIVTEGWHVLRRGACGISTAWNWCRMSPGESEPADRVTHREIGTEYLDGAHPHVKIRGAVLSRNCK